MRKDDRPSLDLSVNVTTTSGSQFRLDPSDARAENRPLAINWRTKLGEGHSDGSVGLSRRVDFDWPDLGLMDRWEIVDGDGQVVYEGYQVGQPRDLDEQHTIGVTLVGPVAELKRRKFVQVYVDRDPQQWGEMPLNERARLSSGAQSYGDFSWTAGTDGLSCGLPNQALGAQTTAQTWYIAPPGVEITAIGYVGSDTAMPASWVGGQFLLNNIDTLTGSAVLSLTLDGTVRTATAATPRRYLATRVYSNGSAATPAAGASRRFTKLAVYGDHSLTTYAPLTSGEPNGVKAVDVVVDLLNRYAPSLDATGVRSSDYVVPHLVYREPTYPYDAILDLNKYLMWKFAVWEGGRVVFEPHDLSDYTWQVRTDDPNVKLQWQGPSTDTIFNGVAVTYTDLLTGRTERLTPDDSDDLHDPDPDNPFNKAGVEQWYEFAPTVPQLPDGATAMAIAALGDANRPKAPGIFTIRGHVRDRAGNWQSVARIRAGDTIAITNHPNDAPRLVVETSYAHDNQEVTVSVDAPPNLLDAIMDRVGVELEAGGLR